VVTRVCVSVCVSVRGHTPTLLHGPGCNLGHDRGCHLVAHYWADSQSWHGLRCYDNITRTLVTSLRPSRDMTTYCERPAGRDLRALLAADWRVTGSVLKIARRIWEVGVTGSPVIGRRRGAFSTLLRQSGLRASTGGVLATKSERKMLASTCLYSLYAWFCLVGRLGPKYTTHFSTRLRNETTQSAGGERVPLPQNSLVMFVKISQVTRSVVVQAVMDCTSQISYRPIMLKHSSCSYELTLNDNTNHNSKL